MSIATDAKVRELEKRVIALEKILNRLMQNNAAANHPAVFQKRKRDNSAALESI